MTLPTPDPIAITRSEQLTHLIRQEIDKSGGHIHFSQFMELALYTPGLGYYSADHPKFGKQGDFVTAPEISPLFARCIAQQCLQVLSDCDSGDMLEIGAGSGVFAKEVLLELEKQGNLPEHYYIFDISEDLRARQKTLLETHCPHLMNRVIWLTTLPNTFSGIIFANEVLDAMPVECFCITQNNLQERCVTWDNNQFTWSFTTPTSQLTEHVDLILQDLHLPSHYESEINLNISTWIHSLAKILKKGLILIIDYGYGRSEYYHPERNHGTLTCFYQHHYHSNPFMHIGLQDITAHVDFTAIAESAASAGLAVAGYTTQAAFLLACGLMELAEQTKLSTIDHYQQNQAIKTLTLPSEMGDIIKVIGLTKQLEIPLKGFLLQDRRRDL